MCKLDVCKLGVCKAHLYRVCCVRAPTIECLIFRWAGLVNLGGRVSSTSAGVNLGGRVSVGVGFGAPLRWASFVNFLERTGSLM